MNYMRKVAGLVLFFFLKPGLCEWKQVASERETYYVDPGSVLLD
ncbi:MAG: hypothetical protein CM15mP58_04060 [Burkholderiaceae bacterium]|nr:MAG: hypothetical protein CM15mP58_04060 [Burkholderiaceae bacterium]